MCCNFMLVCDKNNFTTFLYSQCDDYNYDSVTFLKICLTTPQGVIFTEKIELKLHLNFAFCYV